MVYCTSANCKTMIPLRTWSCSVASASVYMKHLKHVVIQFYTHFWVWQVFLWDRCSFVKYKSQFLMKLAYWCLSWWNCLQLQLDCRLHGALHLFSNWAAHINFCSLKTVHRFLQLCCKVYTNTFVLTFYGKMKQASQMTILPVLKPRQSSHFMCCSQILNFVVGSSSFFCCVILLFPLI